MAAAVWRGQGVLPRRARGTREASAWTALAAAVLVGLLGCQDDPVRRRSADAGLSLLPDAGAEGQPRREPGSMAGVPGGELVPGLDGLGIGPGQLEPDSLPPGLADAGLIPPDFALGAPPVSPAGEAPGAGASGGVVGKPCTSSAECGLAPAFCIPAGSDAEFGGGGPQAGFCSVPCASSAECLAVDGQSGCNTDLGFCLGLCTTGASAAKCGLERPLACVPLAEPGAGVCLPTCTSDAACGAGRFCDLAASGLCRDAPLAGAPVGGACTRDTESADCAGDICLTYRDPLDGVTPVGSFCSANCTLGRLDGCGFDAPGSVTGGGTRGAACLQAQQPGGAAGDLGYCFELCDETSDCAQSTEGWVCEPFQEPGTAIALGRAGRCLPLELSSELALLGLPGDAAGGGKDGVPGLPGFASPPAEQLLSR